MRDEQAFDYVVVGAGSAGAVVAARLSEQPSTTVLLLEAGTDERAADVPLDMQGLNPMPIQTLDMHAGYRWPALQARRSTAQEPEPYLRGRGMGGSSAINGLVAIRGMPEDFDGWAGQGCAGWSWADVLPAFIRLEHDLDFPDSPWHGDRGPIPISRTPLEGWGVVDRAVREAALDLGYGWSEDHNAPGSSGVSPFAMTARGGRRVSTNDAYLEPARMRANLTIQGDALVERILFDRQRATGVRVRVDGNWVEVAGRAIILCAGAVHSPAILQRSGIGPADVLQRLEIDVLRAAPVGENLIDHPIIWIDPHLVSEARAQTLAARHEDCCVRYSSGLAGAGENDMIVLCTNFTGVDEAGLGVAFIGVSAFQAFSRGRLHITTPDPDIDPAIELRMLSDERDLIRMHDGARRLFAIGRHPAVQSISERITLGRSGGLTMGDVADSADLDRWIHASIFDTFHPVGSCRMGRPEDPRSVVDPSCRVIGVEGLRVIDASIMPEIPRANIHLACVMIGEHAAARIIDGTS